MAPISPPVLVTLLGLALLYVVAADQLKVPLFRSCSLR